MTENLVQQGVYMRIADVVVAGLCAAAGAVSLSAAGRAQTQDRPPNWNVMSGDEQAQWLCRDDPGRQTNRCKSVPPPKTSEARASTGQDNCVVPPAPARVDLRVGDPAPQFCLVDASARTYRLTDYKGKAIVLVWFSPTVSKRSGGMIYQTSQCQGLRDARQYLEPLNAVYFMVSVNSSQDNRAFLDQWCPGVNFPVLTDVGGRSAAGYGVLRFESGIDPSAVYGPGAGQIPRDGFVFASTTYIGPDGKILQMEDENEVGRHLRGYGRDVAIRLQQLGVKTIAEVGASPSTKTVELGQTPEQVEAILGKPETVAKLGSKTIYSYRNLKVVFTDGKVTDVQ